MRQGNETKGRGLLERRFEQLLGFFLQLLFDGEVRIQKLVAGFGQVAAKGMGMAYSKAWRIIKDTEAALDLQLLNRDGAHGSDLKVIVASAPS